MKRKLNEVTAHSSSPSSIYLRDLDLDLDGPAAEDDPALKSSISALEAAIAFAKSSSSSSAPPPTSSSGCSSSSESTTRRGPPAALSGRGTDATSSSSASWSESEISMMSAPLRLRPSRSGKRREKTAKEADEKKEGGQGCDEMKDWQGREHSRLSRDEWPKPDETCQCEW